MAKSSRPVTVAVSRRILPGKEREFGEWVQGITQDASRFPGYLGSGYIRPAEADDEHTIVYRFDTPEHFDGWQSSAERLRWVETSRELMTGEPRVETATGLEFWFQDPSCTSDTPVPVWKQALLTWLGLYPTVLVVAYTLGILLARWPIPARSIVTSGITVALMTWLVMPRVTRAFRRWLRPSA